MGLTEAVTQMKMHKVGKYLEVVERYFQVNRFFQGEVVILYDFENFVLICKNDANMFTQ